MNRDRVHETEILLLEFFKHLSEINSYMHIIKMYRHLSQGISKTNSIKEHLQLMLKHRLDNSCINSKCKGYAYLKDAVFLVMRMEGTVNFKKHIYPQIAAKYGNVTADSVEHAIRNAIKSAYLKSHRPGYKNKSDMRLFSKSPSNKRFITDIVKELKRCIHTELLNF